VVGGTTLGTAVGLITYLLTSVVPQWRSGLPEQLAAALPFIVAIAGYFGGGWLAKHRATASEVASALIEAEALLALRDGRAVSPDLLPGLPPSISGHLQAPPVEPAGSAHAPDS
jgi:hypothetical protein